MGKTYRVIVEEIGDSEHEIKLELMAPAEILRTLAPSAVGAVLGAESVQVDAPPADGTPRMAMDAPAPERRKRRTKAEMEAARAAEQRLSEVPTQNVETAEQADEPEPRKVTGDQSAYNPFG